MIGLKRGVLEFSEYDDQWAEGTGWDRVKYTESKGEFVEKVINY